MKKFQYHQMTSAQSMSSIATDPKENLSFEVRNFETDPGRAIIVRIPFPHLVLLVYYVLNAFRLSPIYLSISQKCLFLQDGIITQIRSCDLPSIVDFLLTKVLLGPAQKLIE